MAIVIFIDGITMEPIQSSDRKIQLGWLHHVVIIWHVIFNYLTLWRRSTAIYFTFFLMQAPQPDHSYMYVLHF